MIDNINAEPGQADPWRVIADVMSELLRGGQTADIRCRAAVSVVARAGIDFDWRTSTIAAAPQPAPEGKRVTLKLSETQPAPGDELSQLRELLRLNRQLVVTLRRISSQQEGSDHPEAAYATGCAATMVEALWPVCNEQCTDTTHHQAQPAPELAAAMRKIRSALEDAPTATIARREALEIINTLGLERQ